MRRKLQSDCKKLTIPLSQTWKWNDETMLFFRAGISAEKASVEFDDAISFVRNEIPRTGISCLAVRPIRLSIFPWRSIASRSSPELSYRGGCIACLGARQKFPGPVPRTSVRTQIIHIPYPGNGYGERKGNRAVSEVTGSKREFL